MSSSVLASETEVSAVVQLMAMEFADDVHEASATFYCHHHVNVCSWLDGYTRDYGVHFSAMQMYVINQRVEKAVLARLDECERRAVKELSA